MNNVLLGVTFSTVVLSPITSCLLNKLIHNSKGFVKGHRIIELNLGPFPRKLSLRIYSFYKATFRVYTFIHTLSHLYIYNLFIHVLHQTKCPGG